MLRCHCPQPYYNDVHSLPSNDATTTIFGENWSEITVQNRSSKELDVLWIGVGWHCARSWYGIMPFACEKATLAPGETKTNKVKGYMNWPVVLQGSSMCDLGFHPNNLTPKTITYTVTDAQLKPIWDGGSCFPGVKTASDAVCWVANKAKSLPKALGGPVVSLIYKIMGVKCD